MTEDLDPMLDVQTKRSQNMHAVNVSTKAAPASAVDEELEAEFRLDKKKKKKQKEQKEQPACAAAAAETQEEATPAAGESATDGDDYTFAYLLGRAYQLMMERNPEMLAEKKKMIMKPPSLMRVGTKKTAFVNFSEICRQMRRRQEHVLAYLLSELGTTGSIDANNQLIVKGRFQTKNIESVLRSYTKQYVMCRTCRSHDTELAKETRLVFLQCGACGSRCSVAGIKSGFQAQVGRRAALRAKTA